MQQTIGNLPIHQATISQTIEKSRPNRCLSDSRRVWYDDPLEEKLFESWPISAWSIPNQASQSVLFLHKCAILIQQNRTGPSRLDSRWPCSNLKSLWFRLGLCGINRIAQELPRLYSAFSCFHNLRRTTSNKTILQRPCQSCWDWLLPRVLSVNR